MAVADLTTQALRWAGCCPTHRHVAGQPRHQRKISAQQRSPRAVPAAVTGTVKLREQRVCNVIYGLCHGGGGECVEFRAASTCAIALSHDGGHSDGRPRGHGARDVE